METLCPSPAAALPDPEAGDALECLVFRLGEDAYGIEFTAVREIRGCEGVLPVHGAPAYLKGVINLRGVLVPVVDLRLRLGHEHARYDHVTDILVVETGCGIGGVVVDNISEVAELQPGQHPGGGSESCLSGIAVREGRHVGLLDLGRVFAGVPVGAGACQLA